MSRTKARAEAMARGDTFYTPDTQCKNGHLGPRFVSCGACKPCQVERAATKEGRDKSRQSSAAYYLANKDKCKTASKKWKNENISRVNEKRKDWFRKNYRELHAKNKEAWAAIGRNRRCRISGGGGSHTAKQIADMLDSQDSRCNYCRLYIRYSYHVDHIKPVAKGGSNDISNIQILCAICNQRKGAKYPYTWREAA
ncbi:HNH endonuclease [uncultured Sphingomonas sp.]|uniref:HNH endonuclease n=1 Tax=uncultured Sphingomonas sp. TaxID=158754 RepID=UPI0025928B8E|nr:HNH endonuclease [uncultured Sphingomonas sp.]